MRSWLRSPMWRPVATSCAASWPVDYRAVPAEFFPHRVLLPAPGHRDRALRSTRFRKCGYGRKSFGSDQA
jgi:hypothetical protein